MFRAYFARQEGITEEYKELWQATVFGTGIAICGEEKTDRLFYDPAYQNALHQLNQRLVQTMDLAKNLKQVIHGVLQGKNPVLPRLLTTSENAL